MIVLDISLVYSLVMAMDLYIRFIIGVLRHSEEFHEYFYHKEGL